MMANEEAPGQVVQNTCSDTSDPFRQLLDDPTPDPYPEMDGEVYEMYVEDGVTPEDLQEPGATEFRKWLEATGCELQSVAKSSEHPDAEGRPASKDSAWKTDGLLD